MYPPASAGVNKWSTRVAALARRAWTAMQDDRPLVPGDGPWSKRVNRVIDNAFGWQGVKWMLIAGGAWFGALLICPAAVAVHRMMYGGACI